MGELKKQIASPLDFKCLVRRNGREVALPQKKSPRILALGGSS
jgi:hypothetical protein